MEALQTCGSKAFPSCCNGNCVSGKPSGEPYSTNISPKPPLQLCRHHGRMPITRIGSLGLLTMRLWAHPFFAHFLRLSVLAHLLLRAYPFLACHYTLQWRLRCVVGTEKPDARQSLKGLFPVPASQYWRIFSCVPILSWHVITPCSGASDV